MTAATRAVQRKLYERVCRAVVEARVAKRTKPSLTESALQKRNGIAAVVAASSASDSSTRSSSVGSVMARYKMQDVYEIETMANLAETHGLSDRHDPQKVVAPLILYAMYMLRPDFTPGMAKTHHRRAAKASSRCGNLIAKAAPEDQALLWGIGVPKDVEVPHFSRSVRAAEVLVALLAEEVQHAFLSHKPSLVDGKHAMWYAVAMAGEVLAQYSAKECMIVHAVVAASTNEPTRRAVEDDARRHGVVT